MGCGLAVLARLEVGPRGFWLNKGLGYQGLAVYALATRTCLRVRVSGFRVGFKCLGFSQDVQGLEVYTNLYRSLAIRGRSLVSSGLNSLEP